VLEALLSEGDVRKLSDGPSIDRAARDDGGRWRTVLAALQVTNSVNVSAALQMFHWDTLDRDGTWHVALAGVALSQGLGAPLAKLPCLRLADGSRQSPEHTRDQGLLLGGADGSASSLSERLGLVRPLDEAYFASSDIALRVREWLRRDVGVRTQPGDDDALDALSRRSRSDPLYLDDTALLLLRDALRAVPPSRAAQVGPRIGRRVLVDGGSYEGKTWKPSRVTPADAYLPSAIDTGQDAWAKAAAHTSGLRWVAPRYARDLRPKGGRAKPVLVAPKEQRQRRALAAAERTGVQSFFHELGAETAPRLVARRETDSRHGVTAAKVRFSALTVDQQGALGSNVTMSGLRDDRLSPDLDAVLVDISKANVDDGRPRAQALIRAVSRAWGRLYANHETCEAVNAYVTMQTVGTVPATWIARAACARWMTNELRHKKPPRELAVRTIAFEATFGDAPRLYAYGLGPKDLDANAVRAFRFAREPRASNLLDRLDELRAGELRGKRVDDNAIARCYQALSEAAPTPDSRKRRLDDMKVSDVQKRFRARIDGATGLVRASQGWQGPSEVLLGRAIFKTRRSFVDDDAPALWRMLGMRHPTTQDCVRVLAEIVESGPPSTSDIAVLIETYRYLTRLVTAGEQTTRGFRRTALWTGRKWTTERPVYAVNDPALQVDLGERVAVWRPPVRLRELVPLMRAIGVTYIEEDAFVPVGINTGALAAGSRIQPRLQTAVAHLREWLAVNDAELHDVLATLPELTRARVAVNSMLHVEVPLSDRSGETVPRQAHVQRRDGALLFVFAKATYANDGEIMGRLLGQMVAVDERAQLVLAHGWLRALERVDADQSVTGLELAGAGPEKGPVAAPGKSKVEQKSPKSNGQTTTQPPTTQPPTMQPVRNLQKLKDIKVEVLWSEPINLVDERDATADLGPDEVEPPLQAPKPPGASTKPPKDKAGPASWTAEERETLGLDVLARELRRRYGLMLTDTRKQMNVGADAVDQHGRYYELKAHVGEMPDTVGLQASEFRRAREQKERFVLAVVAGLEEAYETQLRLVADPLMRLKWEPNVDIEVSGLLTASWRPDSKPLFADGDEAT
jgi:hypothetical protein